MEAGRTLAGGLVVEALIHQGATGLVFRAVEIATGKRLAVKIFSERFRPRPGQFELEARTLATLDHPNIVRYHSHGVDESGRAYVVSEWLEGETLAARLERGRLELEQVFDLAMALAKALAFAHSRGVVHRDLKPTNVLIPASGVLGAKLFDFLVPHDRTAVDVAANPSSLGYTAPELLRNEDSVTSAADIFSAGAMLYHAATGAPAFPGTDAATILSRLADERIPPPRTLRPHLPASFEWVLLSMLRMDPSARPQDGHQLLESLRALTPDFREALSKPETSAQRSSERAGPPLAMAGGSAAPAHPSTVKRGPSAKAWVLGGLSLAAAAAVTVAAFMFVSNAKARKRSESPAPTALECPDKSTSCTALPSGKDPRSVELTELLPEMDKLAAQHNPKAKRISLFSTKSKQGRVDLASANVGATYLYEPDKSSGEATDYFNVFADAQRVFLIPALPGAGTAVASSAQPTSPCAAQSAFDAAVGAGLARDYEGMVSLNESPPWSGKFFWLFTHKQTFPVDAKTCLAVSGQALSGQPSPPAEPAGPPVQPLALLHPVGATVVVKNETFDRLSDVELIFVGGQRKVEDLAPGATSRPVHLTQLATQIRYKRGKAPARYVNSGMTFPDYNGGLRIVVRDAGPAWDLRSPQSSDVKGDRAQCDKFRACCTEAAADAACAAAEKAEADCGSALSSAQQAISAAKKKAPPGCR